MKKIEKVIEILFYLLILLYFVGKIFKPISLIIDILFIYQIFKNKEYLINFFQKYKNLIFSFLFFVCYLIFQILFLDLKYFTLISSLETIMYIILFFAILYNFKGTEKIKKVIYISYLILIILITDSFYQYFNGVDLFGKEMWPGGRLTAWADRPDVSLMMGQFFGLLIASIFIFKNKMQKIAIVMFILSFTIFILAGNRSPILAISSVFILMIFFSTYRKYILLLFGLFILIFSMSLLNPKLKTAYGSFLNLSSSQSTSGRYELFDVGFEMIKDNPILGIGSHNYKHKFREYFEKININKYENKTYIEIYSKSNVSHVHSVFLDIVISYGLLGTIIFLLVIFNIYKTFVKNNEIGLLASIGFLYCLTPFQFARSFTMGDWQFITYLGLIFLALISQYKYLETGEKNYEKSI